MHSMSHRQHADTVKGFDYGQEAVPDCDCGHDAQAPGQACPATPAPVPPGTTLSPTPTPPRAKTKPSLRRAASDVPLADPDTLPGVPEKPARISKAYEAAARKTAYQIYEELNNSRSLEGVAHNGGFDLADVTRWAQEDNWEQMFQADKREVEALAIQEGNPTQAIKLRASMKVDCLHALERDISCEDAKYGLKQTERKAIFDMVKDLTDSEVGADKMRAGKIIILMDKDAYVQAAMSRKDQLKSQQDENLYDQMVEKYVPKKQAEAVS